MGINLWNKNALEGEVKIAEINAQRDVDIQTSKSKGWETLCQAIIKVAEAVINITKGGE